MTTVKNVSTTKQLEAVLQNSKTESYINSAFTVQKGGTASTENVSPQNSSNVDKLLEKLCAEFQGLGLKIEDLKKQNILEKVSGKTTKELQCLSQAELDKIYSSLKQAIKDSVKNNTIDLGSIGKLGNNYYIAQKTGWSIDGLKKYNKNVKKSTLLERLQETNCIPKGAKLEDLSSEELKGGIKKFFENTLLGNIKNAKTQQEKDKIYKAQLQTFGRLLINSPENEKTLFIEVAKSLYADVRLEGFKAVIESCEKGETKTNCLLAADNPEYKKAFTTQGVYDKDGNLVDDKVISQEEALEFQSYLSKNLPENRVRESHQRDHKVREDWFKQNGEALAAIKNKLDNPNFKEDDLTEPEKKLLLEYRNYIVAGQSGELLGASMNEKFTSEEAKREFLQGLNEDNYELPSYKDVLILTNDFVENHPEALTIPKEELIQILDKATNGNYSIVASGSGQELNAPGVSVTTSSGNATNSDGSFVLPANTAQLIADTSTRVAELKSDLHNDDEKETFVVEHSSNSDKKSYTRVEYAINDGAGYSDIKGNFGLNTIVRYFNKIANSYDKKALAHDVATDQNKVSLVNAGGNALAVAVSNVKKFTEQEVEKLNYISGIVKDAIGYDDKNNDEVLMG